MTGEKNMAVNSALPLDARAARIVADGGLAASLHEFPSGKNEKREGLYAAGSEPDGLDFIMPRAAESRVSASASVPFSAVHQAPVPSENPT